jgi:hypothetical protein
MSFTKSTLYEEWRDANNTYENVLRELSDLRKAALEANSSALLYTEEAKGIKNRATDAYLTQHALHKRYMASIDDTFKPVQSVLQQEEDSHDNDDHLVVSASSADETAADQSTAELVSDKAEGDDKQVNQIEEIVNTSYKADLFTPTEVAEAPTEEAEAPTESEAEAPTEPEAEAPTEPETEAPAEPEAEAPADSEDTDADVQSRIEMDMVKMHMLTELSVLSQV